MNRYSFRDKDETIRRLENDLWMARYSLLNTLPSAQRRLLTSYHDCETRNDTYGCLDRIAEEITSAAKSLPSRLPEWMGARALCPLCGGGSSAPFEEGYALPEGLRRHIVGFGNTHQCIFSETAHKLALDDWHKRFSEADAKEEIDRQKRKRERRTVERQYLIAPFGCPKLFDEGSFYRAGLRSSEEMQQAKDRLQLLGLRHVVDGNIESWTDDRQDWIVYADPRQNGRIEFTVWRKPLPKRESKNPYSLRIMYFYMLDSWKNDIKKKYEARLPTGS